MAPIVDRSGITSRHAELLSRNGVNELLRVGAGLLSLPLDNPDGASTPTLPHGIALPVPNPDGSVATLRLFPDPDPFGTQPLDLAQFDPSKTGWLDIDGAVRVLPTPFVARSAASTLGPVVVATHDLWALAIAGRTGLAVVSTCGELLLEQAARIAAALAAGEPIILLPYFGAPLSRSGVRRLTVVAGIFSRHVLIGTWTGRSVDGLSAARMATASRAGPGGLWGGRSALAPGPAVLATEGPGAVLAEVIGNLVAAVFVAAAKRISPDPGPRGAPPQREYLELAVEIERLAAAHGAETAVLGGVAIDTLLGQRVRDRKDLDLALVGGSLDALERVAGDLVARGFELSYRRSQCQAVLRRGTFVVDLYRLLQGEPGTLFFATRTCCVAFDASDWQVDVRHEGIALRVASPPLLYYMKLVKMAEVGGLLLGSIWEGSLPDRADLAALQTMIDPADVARRIRKGSLQRARMGTFALRPLPGFRSAWRRLTGRRSAIDSAPARPDRWPP